uniref:Cystatin domain-containing protein n=1 Tax=Strongyloides venezuelensis TaxID=75913 RepID=A0A0K0FS50_STRVS
MKYLITFIVIVIIIFVTINTKNKSKPKPSKITTPLTSLKWRQWDGKSPYSAKEIVKNATNLYYNKTGIYYNVTEIFLNQKRIINGTNRYRVKYIAVQCILDKKNESQKSGKKINKSPKNKKPQCFETLEIETPLQALLRDDTQQNQLVLNVTNLFTDDSYKEIYKKDQRKKKLRKIN